MNLKDMLQWGKLEFLQDSFIVIIVIVNCFSAILSLMLY